MNKQFTPAQFLFHLLRACGISLLIGSGFTAAIAAPSSVGSQVSTVPGPVATKPGSAFVPTPATLYPDIIADGGGITINNKFVAFNGSIAINSTTIMPSSPGATACRYTGSFTLKNVGGGSPSSVGVNSFDVNTTVEQPQVGKIDSEGYSIPDLKPGATYPQPFRYDLKPGSYVIWLTIDPYHKLKQATPGVKQYHVQLNVTCDRGGSMQFMPGPAKSMGGASVKPGGTVNGAAPENPGSTKMLNLQPFPPKQGKTGGVELPAVQLPAVQK